MPRGRSPSGMVAITFRVVRSTTDTLRETSLLTNASGFLACAESCAPTSHSAEAMIAHFIGRVSSAGLVFPGELGHSSGSRFVHRLFQHAIFAEAQRTALVAIEVRALGEQVVGNGDGARPQSRLEQDLHCHPARP